MSDESYPRDAIGNPIRRGDLVRVALTEAALIFRVAEVQPAGLLSAPNGGDMALNGKLILQAVVPVEFVGGAAMTQMLVLKTPEQDSIQVTDRMPKEEVRQ